MSFNKYEYKKQFGSETAANQFIKFFAEIFSEKTSGKNTSICKIDRRVQHNV